MLFIKPSFSHFFLKRRISFSIGSFARDLTRIKLVFLSQRQNLINST